MDYYVENPETGRMIKVNGPTFKNLPNTAMIDMDTLQRKVSPKRSPRKISPQRREMPVVQRNAKGAKGWRDVSPRRGSPRKQLVEKCGPECFIDPDNLGFPICPKDKCQIDCRGVLAAKIRAAQWKYDEAKAEADRIGKKAGCRWSK